MSAKSTFTPTALAVALCSVTGIAVAASGEAWQGGNYKNQADQEDTWSSMKVEGSEGSKGSFSNAGTLVVEGALEINGIFNNTGSISAGKVDILTTNSPLPVFDGLIVADEIVYRGTGANTYGHEVSGAFNTDHLQIVGQGTEQTGLSFSKQESVENIGKVTVVSNGGKTGLQINSGAQELSFDAVELIDNSSSQDARVQVATGSVHINTLTTSGRKTLVQSDNLAPVAIDTIYVGEGTILNLQTLGGSKEKKSKFTLSQVTVGSNGNIRASVFDTNAGIAIVGQDLVLNLYEGATVDFGGWKQTGDTTWRSEDITLTANSLTVNVLDAGELPTVYLSAHEGNVAIRKGIHVVSASSNNTGNAQADLERLTKVVVANDKSGDAGQSNVQPYQGGFTVYQLADDLHDGATATVDGLGNLTNVVVQTNPNINGIAGVATLGLHLWRNEMNDVTKRLGDLRVGTASDVNGFWLRIYNGQADLNGRNVKNEYTSVQIGADREVWNGVRMGVAFSYTDGNNDIGSGSGDSSVMALTGYATKFFENGLFVDVTAKYGRIDNEFDILIDRSYSKGEYDTNAIAFSFESGWRYEPVDRFYVEPQVELMYGRIDDVDYNTSTGLQVKHDDADTLVGRAGVVLGINCPNDRGNAYLRASVLHDWRGEANYSFTKGGVDSRYLTDDLGGTWYEFGLGADLKVSDHCLIYADAETSSGGEVDTDYRVNVGVRWGF